MKDRQPGAALLDDSDVAPLLEARGIVKDFPGQRALDEVSLSVRRGKIYALLGENGAGKSTLIKIITGVYQPSAGELLIEGRYVHFPNPHAAQAAGIAVVHQHGNLVPTLSVQENLMLGERLPRYAGLLINWRRVRDRQGRGDRRKTDYSRRTDDSTIAQRGRHTVSPDAASCC